MALAIQQADVGRYTAHPNPRVGCVLVQGDQCVGAGGHRAAGEPHAERMALAAAGSQAAGATAYVTLEPCSHFGRTPPCVDGLIEAGVSRVVYACEDPNPRTRGRARGRLEQAGIGVTTGVLAEAARRLNPGFFQRFDAGRPWVRLKLAMSLDGRTAMASGESQWITGEAARLDVHRMRAEASAIATGVETVLADNPRLTARGIDTDRQPMRVVFDSRFRTPADAAVCAGDAPVLLLGAAGAHAAAAYPEPVECLAVPGEGEQVDLGHALQMLAGRDVHELFIECGATLAGALVAANLVDELVIYMAPRLLGNGARGLVELPGLEHLAQTPMLEIVDVRKLGADWRMIARPVMPAQAHPKACSPV